MKLTTGILIVGMTAATAWGQNPNVIQKTRDTMHAVQQNKQLDSNAALAASQGATAEPASAQPSPRSAAAQSSPRGPFTSPLAAKTQRPAKSKTMVAAIRKPQASKQIVAVKNEAPAKPESKAKPVSVAGRRDPFVNPVVNQAMVGSGCSTGKRCLAIDQIALKGVVKSDGGMIAVVVNALDKAYFLRENDPVFNGYVVKITGDSIVFKETVQDRIGHPFTREVTKKISTPAV
jgi:Tfp pilus assembly protein PilP